MLNTQSSSYFGLTRLHYSCFVVCSTWLEEYILKLWCSTCERGSSINSINIIIDSLYYSLCHRTGKARNAI